MSFNFENFVEDARQFIGKYYTHSVHNTTVEKVDGDLVLKILGAHDSVIKIKDDGDEVYCSFFEHHWHEYKDDAHIAESILGNVFNILSGNWASYTLYSVERLYAGGIAFGTDEEIVKKTSGHLKGATHVRLKRWLGSVVEYERPLPPVSTRAA